MTHGFKFSIVAALGAVVVFFSACGEEVAVDTPEPVGPLSGELLAPRLPAPNLGPLRLEVPAPRQPRVERYVLLIGPGGGMRVALRDTTQERLAEGYLFETWLRLARNDDQVIACADGLEIGVKNGVLYATVGATALDGYMVVANEWYNVAVVVRREEATFYLNGWLQDREFLASETVRLGGALLIGGDLARRPGFVGAVENVRLTALAPDMLDLSITTHNLCTKRTLFAFDFDGPAHGVWAESRRRVVPALCGVGLSASLTPPALLSGGEL